MILGVALSVLLASAVAVWLTLGLRSAMNREPWWQTGACLFAMVACAYALVARLVPA